MNRVPITREIAKATVASLQEAVDDGFKLSPGEHPSAIEEGRRRWIRTHGGTINRDTFRSRIKRSAELYGLVPKIPEGSASKVTSAEDTRSDPEIAAEKVRRALKAGPKTLAHLAAKARMPLAGVFDAIEYLRGRGVNITRTGDFYDIPPKQRESYIGGTAVEIASLKNNTFIFGAIGDLHAGSKYTRWDVREDLIRQAEKAGAQAIFDTGNWIDGEAPFNRHDLVAHGLEPQCQLLAEKHPRTKLPIYAVAGDDHEGWLASREGVDVGKYCEAVMRDAGHDWTDLGYMEAHVVLKNSSTGKKATLAVVHPGGGSAYALSYSIQKIVESYEGGEKPHVAFYGHYHKLWAGIIRNIWVAQTGTAQDQTPFMRKKRLEAHVGGLVVTLEQDPASGAIMAMTPKIIRYFNEGFYKGSGRWSHHGPVVQPKRSTRAIRG